MTKTKLLLAFFCCLFVCIDNVSGQTGHNIRYGHEGSTMPDLLPCSAVLISQFDMTTQNPFVKTIDVEAGDKYYFIVSNTMNFYAGSCSRYDGYYQFLYPPIAFMPAFSCNYIYPPPPVPYNPSHVYSSCIITAGTEPLIFSFGDSYYQDNCGHFDFSVYHIINYPAVNLGNDTSMCPNSSLILDAGNPGCTYLWNNGGSAQTLTVQNPGTYSVTVTNGSSPYCISTDTILVELKGAPQTPEPISGYLQVLQGQTGVEYSVTPNVNATTYQWSVPPGSTITSPTNSPSIVVDFGNNAISGDIQASCVNSCGNSSDTAILHVTVVPSYLILQDDTLIMGQDSCYNAAQTVVIAGGGTSFVVQNGGSATFIAGQNIIFHASSLVESGGYLHGYITQTNQYCNLPEEAFISSTQELEKPQYPNNDHSFRIFPNPTSGNFTLVVSESLVYEVIDIEIFNCFGELVIKHELTGKPVHQLTLSEQPAGLYIARIISDNKSKILKIIKN